MGLDIVLNEVSLINAARDIRTAKQLMSDLFDTIGEAASAVGRGNLSIEVCTPGDLPALSLAPGYTVRHLFSDKTVDERQRRLFINIAINKPYIDDVTEVYEEEFRFQQEPVKSLGHACRRGALAVSLRSKDCWDDNRLKLERHRLDDVGELTVDLVDVIHASRTVHVQDHSYWIRSSLQAEAQDSISDGATLWKRREELFPHLQFCAVVEMQLHAVLRGGELLRPVLGRLFLLEHFCKDWLEGPFKPERIACNATPESAATLKQYGSQRTFSCPDGEMRLFSWHVRLTPHAWRIHFFPLEGERRLIVGYIGCHLPTVRYR
jgi:hypothetical protein